MHDDDTELRVVTMTSALDDTPEGMFRIDRLNAFDRGRFGDIDILDEPPTLHETLTAALSRIEHDAFVNGYA